MRRTLPQLLPAGVVLLLAFFVPLVVIVWRSVSDPQIGLQNYVAIATDGVSLPVLGRTFLVALLVTGLTLVLAFPYAYAMTLVGARTRRILTILVLLPFWTSLLARNYAWYVLEQRGGLIESVLRALGIPGVVLLGTLSGVVVAMVQVLLPYMVLPLYSTMSGIDRRLMRAGRSLGATRVQAFTGIYLPLTAPGIVSGFTLVFIMCLGFYITPALLGSPQQALVSQVIASRVQNTLDFAGGGALGAVLLVLTLVVVLVSGRLGRPADALKGAVRV
ncbi:ABC transporter permease [Rathayibacter sp. Leaf296]|uniref:ABC transporter permease n=1 Tax=Rathayibacter sp. Leaf296 TaxID=1736327 RepID=UPI000703A300|nr:ABC transporter permease [Rathayibacter sp. Leaf296]KQQ08512.1 ABC transporter permease [Rathayibacter sp. Leaf296]